MDIFVRDREHPPRTAGRIIESLDDSPSREDFSIGDEEEVDHQSDDFTGSKVIASLLVAGFIKPPDQFFKDVPHLNIGHHVRVEINLIGKFRDDEKEAVILLKFLDLFFKTKFINNITGIC